MNAPATVTSEAAVTSAASLGALLEKQRAAFLLGGPPTFADRIADLTKLKTALLARRNEFAAAVDADFGHRPSYETAIMEIVPLVQGIDYLKRNLKAWMRPRRRRVGVNFLPGKALVLYQPLGVVGIMSPWNYPLSLTLMPLATAIAAGNRAIIKPSEFTPKTAELLAAMLGEIFTEEQVAVATGGPEVGAAFSALAFDHLIFTGSTNVGRAVMRAASDHLVPVTLELGGKSPVIVEGGFSLERAAASIAIGKLANAGQTCIAPDYALLREADIEPFIAAFAAAAARLYPGGPSDPAFASIINPHHYARLTGLIADARAKGARIIELGAADSSRPHTLAPKLVLGATPDMRIMQEEIFGPVLPILPYRDIDEAIAFVNARARPLALYIFGEDGPARRKILERTTSGNVTINDTVMHYSIDDLPFGGVGASGIGAYHGEEGFKALSHAKGVFEQAKWNLAALLRPPFGRVTDAVLSRLLR
ncbi:coniferyl aldehyde dehydrogenase [Methylocella sp.]|jgi:coniferyl-aldehyde dehydrogenase|uniref:coniferyl aldehyde dehydrogenase n=1 Tax=Methylocella sp. TaxID=1978226 RepID=UPI003C2131C7